MPLFTISDMFQSMKTIQWKTKHISVLMVTVVILSLTYLQFRHSHTEQSSSSTVAEGISIVGREQQILENHPLNSDNSARRFELKDGDFYINEKKTRILSGAIHYFRVVPEYWQDRLYKLKAAGLNTVETYVPWNKHEEFKGDYNFQGMYDIRKFIRLAQNLNLYVILRPGPYICSEWEFGGLPSWLLREDRMKVRSSYPPFLSAVEKYFKQLFQQVVDLQFHRGGPIIMVQIENEYSSFGEDVQYMLLLKQMMEESGIRELLFTSDNKGGLMKMDLPGVLKTANFKSSEVGGEMLRYLMANQPGKPRIVMEFWSGWFDQWRNHHQTFSTEEFREALEYIIEAGASVNFYMFHGGTNFGFMNGKNGVDPDVTSYDYDAPLSESGDLQPKYYAIRETVVKYHLNETALLPFPTNIPKTSYGTLVVDKLLDWESLLGLVQSVESSHPVTMEMLDRNQGSGQSFGFIMYRHTIPLVNRVDIVGHMADRVQILVNGREIQVMEEHARQSSNKFSILLHTEAHLQNSNILDILVENTGRTTWGAGNVFNEQRKGLDGTVTADNFDLNKWKIYSLEFKSDFIQGAAKSNLWQPYSSVVTAPALYKFILTVDASPKDTFLNMRGWTKGVVFVNGFNIGRYWNVGPTRTLYVPGPILRSGQNQVIVFELHKPNDQIISMDTPILN